MTPAPLDANSTLLAALADRFVVQRENLATEALVYLLGDSAVADALHRHVARFCSALPPSNAYRTQQTHLDDDAIPDVAGIGPNQRVRLLIEAKFDAALTDKQPVEYLQRLLKDDEPGLLLFLVPHRRVSLIWAELQQRCHAAGHPLQVADDEPIGTHSQVAVGVTTWSALLDEIQHALVGPEHARRLAEVLQLRGLCDRADREAFVPFRSEEMQGSIGQRVVDLNALMSQAVDALVARGLADVKGLRWAAGQVWIGRWFKTAGSELLLRVDFDRWSRLGRTPLWLDMPIGVRPALADGVASELTRGLVDEGGRCLLPIDVPTNADRDTTLRHVVASLCTVCTAVVAAASEAV